MVGRCRVRLRLASGGALLQDGMPPPFAAVPRYANLRGPSRTVARHGGLVEKVDDQQILTQCNELADELGGRWVTDRVYSQLHEISRQTLANWRYRDRKAGRTQAAPGYPIYRHFGEAVRYWLPRDL